MEEYFVDHPLSIRVLGTQETVKRLKTSEMRAYHEQRYAADNLCLVACGAVDFDRLVDDVAKLTENWKTAGVGRSFQKPPTRHSSVQLVHEPAVQQYTLQYASGPHRTDPMKFATRVMAASWGMIAEVDFSGSWSIPGTRKPRPSSRMSTRNVD